MGIEIRAKGEAAATAKAGATVGRGKRAEEERARAEREQARADQIAAQQSARRAALEWEQQKMLLNSQQDFAHEMRMRQAELDREARAQEWFNEKMELTSKFDFEQEEQERIRDNAEAVAGEKVLLEAPMGDAERERAFFNLWQKHPNARNLLKYSGYREEKQPSISFTAKKSAAKYLEETELGWKERHMPGFLGGRELTETEQQLRLEAEQILAPNIPTGTISSMEPIYQENKRTGQKRVSYDNGKTWNLL